MAFPQEFAAPLSRRIQQTDAPCIVKTKKLMAGREGVLSLAQGVVHWPPPEEAVTSAAAMANSLAVHSYGPDEGLPELREALREKLRRQNGLEGYDVMVTAGCNQAFLNVVVALLDPEDTAVLFRPYYFNHLMAIQMTGGGDRVVYGPCDPSTWHPDLDWLEGELSRTDRPPPRMVVLVNPCNPSGVLLTQAELHRAADLCATAGTWLVLDNTYEDFVYGEGRHHCVGGPHVISLFSFSKAYGMMGWRVGYIAFPEDGTSRLAGALVKVQDTVPVCAPQLSQHVALGALRTGSAWVQQRVAGLAGNREALIDALSPLGSLGSGVGGGEGAIYLWARLPEGCEDDEAVVGWLVREHGVCVIPGSSCGCPGYVRAAYANLQPEACRQAAARLKAGLQELVALGPAVLEPSRALTDHV